MAIRESVRLDGSMRSPAEQAARTEPAPNAFITTQAARFLAVFRVALGFVFLWAFLDKTFGFGYATSSAKAWINGGSPTKGFLSRVAVGPFESIFHDWAGAVWADWLFMLGLLGWGPHRAVQSHRLSNGHGMPPSSLFSALSVAALAELGVGRTAPIP